MTAISRRPRTVALPLGLLLLLAGTSHAAECPVPASTDRAVLAANQALRQAQGQTADDENDNSVSPALSQAIEHYKQALAIAFDAHLACADAQVQADTLQNDLRQHLLPPEPATQPATDSNQPPPSQDALNVTLDTTVSPLLLVNAAFDIPCGSDNLLLGYRRSGDHWVRALDWKSGAYSDISGAYGDVFLYTRLASGDLALIHGTPWCTSRWSHLALDVIRPANEQQAQRSLLHTEHDYVRDDTEVRLKARPDGFEWRGEVGSLDGDLMTRPGIFRYRQDGDTFQRVQPAASNGRGFVDEWLRVDDAVARDWTDPTAADATLAARAELVALEKRPEVTLTYAAVRSCKADPAHFQVDIELDSAQPLAEGNQRYIGIRQQSNGFTLLSLSKSADPACSGPDLMAKRN